MNYLPKILISTAALAISGLIAAYIYQYQRSVRAHIAQNDKMYSMIEDIWNLRNAKQ
jgi:hypothetical protein